MLQPHESPEGEAVAQRRTRVIDAMKRAEVLVVMSGQYERFRSWLDFDLSAAKAHIRPVVLVEPFGPNDAPDELKRQADVIVGWDSRSLEDAIRVQARQDMSKRYDVIDFDL